MAIEEGANIQLEYTGTLDDGSIFDSTKGKPPMGFELKEGNLIPGFYHALIGMEVGDEKAFRKIEVKDKEDIETPKSS